MVLCCSSRWLPWLPHPLVGGGGGGGGNNWQVTPTVVLVVKSQ